MIGFSARQHCRGLEDRPGLLLVEVAAEVHQHTIFRSAVVPELFYKKRKSGKEISDDVIRHLFHEAWETESFDRTLSTADIFPNTCPQLLRPAKLLTQRINLVVAVPEQADITLVVFLIKREAAQVRKGVHA